MSSLILPDSTVAAQNLCDASGRLDPRAVGWSPRPLVECALPGNWGRRKRWNHWCITTPHWMLTLTLADLDYVSYGGAHFLDLDSGKLVSHTQRRPFGMGCHLPDNAMQSHAFNHHRLQLRADDRGSNIRLTATAPRIGGQPLQLALDIQRPAHLDSVNLVCAMGEKTFHATSRQLGLPVSGNLQLGGQTYSCPPGQSFASLDFGRGVWPLRTHWKRVVFSAPGGIAGNFGSGWCDASGLSENALWFGGELLHLNEPVTIEQHPSGALAPWHLSCASEHVDLTFTPLQHHHARPQVGPFFADTRQWFGYFDGILRGPRGEKVPVARAYGWLGETRACW
ncbi:DUF2804 domain-containing protein [Pseudomonas sp. Marseille-Q8238]